MKKPQSLSTIWQNIAMAVVTLSLILAVLGYEPATRMWIEGWDGIVAYLGVGVGIKMVQRSTEKYIDKKYGSPDRGVVGD